MFGHQCDESISLIAPHPFNGQIVLCTIRMNLTVLDLNKNRSIRTFSVPSSLPKDVLKSIPIGLYFIDNVTCLAIQSLIHSTCQTLPCDYYIALVFPKGMVCWNHTMESCTWIAFESFTASCIAQTPESFIMADGNTIYSYSLTNKVQKKLVTAQGPVSQLFIMSMPGDQYGILSISTTGIYEVFNSSGKQTAQFSGDFSKNICFDIFSDSLFVVADRKKVKVFQVTPTKIDRLGECSFTGVTAGESKPTNYPIQQICPCRLPVTARPHFLAICDQTALFVAGVNKPVQRVSTFPAKRNTKKIKKFYCSLMLAHPTDLSMVIMAGENKLLVIDLWAHMPRILPSLPIPSFLEKQYQMDGIFTVRSNEEITVVLNHSTESYTVYNKATNQIIVTRNALDVIVGSGRKYAELRSIKNKVKGLPKAKDLQIALFDGTEETKTENISHTADIQYPLRLLSIDQYIAIISASDHTDLAFYQQQQGHIAAFVYSWADLTPISLQLEGAVNITFQPPLIALASPSNYAIYDTTNGMVEIVRRQRRIFDFKFFQGKLYLLTENGLEIDNLKSIELLNSRFSHLLTREPNSPPIPINSLMIMNIKSDSLSTEVTIIDNMGHSKTVGIVDEKIDDNEMSCLIKIANSPDSMAEAAQYFRTGTEEQQKRILLMMMRKLDFEQVKKPLLEAEKIALESALDNCTPEDIDAFNAYLATELEVESS